MAGHGAVVGFGGTLRDRDHARDPAWSDTVRIAAWLAFGAPAAQIGRQVLAELASGLDEQRLIDRFVRHPHLRPVRELRRAVSPRSVSVTNAHATRRSRTHVTRRRPPTWLAWGVDTPHPPAAQRPTPDSAGGHHCEPPRATPSRSGAPTPRPIAANDKPYANPARISSRSASDNQRTERQRTTGGIPPLSLITRATVRRLTSNPAATPHHVPPANTRSRISTRTESGTGPSAPPNRTPRPTTTPS